MTPSARLAAAAEILDGFDWNAPADPQLRAWARANRYAGSKDRRAINDRVYGCLRRARSLAAGTGGEGRAIILKSLRDLDGLSPGGIEALCAGLGHGLAPLTDAEAAMLSLEPVWESEAERLDWPEWLWAEAQRSLGEDAADELEALRRRAPVDLRVNTLLTGRDAAQGVLAEEGVETESLALGETTLRAAPSAPVARSRAYLEGLVELQDAASQAVAEFAGAAPGMTVLDFCAGGGGKTLALAAAMEGEGRLVAHDVEARRMRDLPDRAARAGAGFIEIMAGASAMQSLEGACDIVVVDAPCSGAGSWRRDPMGKWRLTPDRLHELMTAQDDALRSAARYLRPGGALLYATCSFLQCENEERIAAFLSEESDFNEENALSLRPARDGCDGFTAFALRRYA